MMSHIPSDIQNLLDDFLSEINAQKANLLRGFYLYGSLAYGAYNPQKSDIDFIAILNRPCTEDDLKLLAETHAQIRGKYPSASLEGSYLQANDLGKLNSDLAPYPYFDGEFHPAGHYDVNTITWWTLKEQGICIYGEALKPDAISLSWQTVIKDMHANLNIYWQDWASNPEKQQLLIHDGAIEWAVLGVLRQYYSFREQAITSKKDAGQYALLHLNTDWHPLIKDALLIRDNQQSLYHDKLLRRETACDFLTFMIAESNAIYRQKI